MRQRYSFYSLSVARDAPMLAQKKKSAKMGQQKMANTVGQTKPKSRKNMV